MLVCNLSKCETDRPFFKHEEKSSIQNFHDLT